MATLQDIADVVGVSTVTVSKVLRGKVKGSYARSAKQAQRIRQVADELGYRVDWRARALKTKQTHMIGLLYTDKPQTRTHDTTLIDALVETLGAAGYHMVFVRIRRGSRGNDFADARFDGVIVDYHIEPEEMEIIRQNDLPAVIINAPGQDGVAAVMPDHRAAGRLAADYLLGLGHGRIAFVQASTTQQALWPTHMCTQWREGIAEAMTEAGFGGQLIDIIPEQVAGDETEQTYHTMLRDVCERPDRPTAIIADNPQRAAEFVLRNLRKLGLRCPEDVSVFSMGDERALRWCTPSLTALNLPFGEIGRAAARLLIDQIECTGGVTPKPDADARDLRCRIVERESTSPAPAEPLRRASREA